MSDNEDLKEERKRFVILSWKLIEYKLMYYYPELIDKQYHDLLTVPDDYYDALEQEYLHLCLLLDENNTIVHKTYAGFEGVKGEGMLEVDLNRSSVRLVLRKYGINK